MGRTQSRGNSRVLKKRKSNVKVLSSTSGSYSDAAVKRKHNSSRKGKEEDEFEVERRGMEERMRNEVGRREGVRKKGRVNKVKERMIQER